MVKRGWINKMWVGPCKASWRDFCIPVRLLEEQGTGLNKRMNNQICITTRAAPLSGQRYGYIETETFALIPLEGTAVWHWCKYKWMCIEFGKHWATKLRWSQTGECFRKHGDQPRMLMESVHLQFKRTSVSRYKLPSSLFSSWYGLIHLILTETIRDKYCDVLNLYLGTLKNRDA